MNDSEIIAEALRVFFPRLTRQAVENGDAGALHRHLSPSSVGRYLAQRLVPPIPVRGVPVSVGGIVDEQGEAAFESRVCFDPGFAREALDRLRETLVEYPARVFDYFCVAAALAKWHGCSMVPETDGLFPPDEDDEEAHADLA